MATTPSIPSPLPERAGAPISVHARAHSDRVSDWIALDPEEVAKRLDTDLGRGLSPSEAERRRAELLGVTLQLGYRISAAVPDLLATSRLRIAGDELRLDLPAPDAAPDPEILKPRVRAVAKALGLSRFRVEPEP